MFSFKKNLLLFLFLCQSCIELVQLFVSRVTICTELIRYKSPQKYLMFSSLICSAVRLLSHVMARKAEGPWVMRWGLTVLWPGTDVNQQCAVRSDCATS